MAKAARSFLLALQFLTVVTLRSDLKADKGDLARSRNWFAPVGAFLGGVLCLVAWLLGQILPPLVLAAMLAVFWEKFSRFLHLDGLADTTDALMYYAGKERSLEIMSDTKLGTFGVAAIAGLLLIKFAALVSLSGQLILPALFLAPILGRGAAASLSALLPPAKQKGLGALTAEEQSLAPFFVSLAVCVIASLALGTFGLICLAAALALNFVFGAILMCRIGGVTGDTLGASIELTEMVTLIVMSAPAA